MKKNKHETNSNLRTTLFKFGITYDDVSTVIGVSKASIVNKMKKKTFTQQEMELLLRYLKNHDESISFSIFFEN